MDIPSQVHIELIHRDNLTITSTCSTTLDSKGRALARLPNIGERNLAQMSAESLGQAYGGGLGGE